MKITEVNAWLNVVNKILIINKKLDQQTNKPKTKKQNFRVKGF